ncbi:MAG: hypothetical protein K6B42_09720 [Clostridia bacterium]|nr:hypothetical protein [Clostridia bacterium]
MKVMKRARITAMIVAVTMVFAMAPLLPMNAQMAFAEDDTNAVVAETGESKTVNDNVSVQNEPTAVTARTQSDSGKASVTVNGNVTLKNGEGNATAVVADSHNGNASATVNGDVNAQGEYYTYGAVANADYEATGSADVTVGGTVTVKAEYDAYGVGAYNGTVTVDKDVSAEGYYATGVEAEGYGSDHIASATIKGTVSATGERATGVLMQSIIGIADEGVSVTIGKGVTATSTRTGDSNYFANDAYGVIIQNEGGNIQADITGDVTVKAPTGNAVGMDIAGGVMNEWLSDIEGTNTIQIHGSVISDGVGIRADVQDPVKTDILIEDVLDAKDVGVLLGDMRYNELMIDSVSDIPAKQSSTGGNLNLTVWKVNLNANGNVAEMGPDFFVQPMGMRAAEAGDLGRSAARDFEKNNIMYIVRIEQPAKGGKLSATDANGNALAKSFGYDVAKEGNKVLLKIEKQKGFELVAAYNGKDRVPLLKDADGNYYLVVPKGGGIYLSAVFKEVPVQQKERTSSNGNTVAAPAGGFKAGLVLNGEEAEKGGTEDLFWKNMQLMAKADPTCTMTCLGSKDAEAQKENFEKLYEEGYDLILCTNDMADLVKEEAENHPDQHFVMIGGKDPQLDDVANVIFTDGGKVMKKTPNDRQVDLALTEMCDMEKAGLFEGGQYKYDTED